ncbi:sugar ABC transporter ATP-binding protein [Aliiroseovarius sediminis]|uniref:sugar ABC transporter ATP-binding protein n=1 Tax=Aliiroseovarius sediminis TaxID=2925839 RepID=UPI001F57463D|nr:sugar ABC transporter ATP-binding protein [Aliiroseovarius sediminis]MCI2395998.1 sugar ABC transporter ATP-binding protein [Aliiroseovarius sediminis]
MTDTEIAVRMNGVAKSFGKTRILNDISIDFLQGSVHALVGENGAGKSSVGKIIGGYYAADEGTVDINGETVSRFSPRDALQRGVAMIHQELQLVPDLTVLQNVFLGLESQYGGILVQGDVARFRALEETCQFGLDPHAKVARLRIAERQKVEIMRAVAREARIIIMDEPTSSLTEDEAERLHALIARLKARGKTIIYVSHFLDHIIANCDRVTVMRDGQVIRNDSMAGETKQSLVDSMLGQASEISWPTLPDAPAAAVPPLVELKDVHSDTGLDGVSLTIRPGEIVGLIGLVGSGRTEIGRVLFGADRITSGAYLLDGQLQGRLTISKAVQQGLALVPEDRRKQGLVLTQTTRPNVSLASLDKISRYGVLDQRSERARVKRMIDHFGIVPGRVDGDVAFYSGGNQQKVLLSKWAVDKPRLLILDEPSRGVDIGARQRIHEFIVEMAEAGTAILLISSEIEEVINLSHRGYLMSEGRIFFEASCADLNVDEALNRIFHEQGADPSSPERIIA